MKTTPVVSRDVIVREGGPGESSVRKISDKSCVGWEGDASARCGKMSGSGIRRAFGKAPGSLDPSSAALPECWTKPSSGRNWMDGEMARCLALGRGGRGEGGADPRGSRRGAGRGSSNATWARCKQAGGPSARVELSDWPSNSTVHLRPSLGGGAWEAGGRGGLGQAKKRDGLGATRE